METKSIKILAIDDNPDNLISLNALIKEAFPNVRTLTALNGAKGLELASAEDPDLVLLDIVMPGMDGFEVCRRLKADKALCDIPVVFITALKGDKESRIHALEIGAEAFLAKPIDETELRAQIRAMVKIKTANVEKRNENERLASLVAERTSELEFELAERKKAENALRESEERFRRVTQSANDAIITTDSKGLVLGWNYGAEKIFGYAEAEIMGQKLTLIVPYKFEKLHEEGMERISAGGEHHVIGRTVELVGLHKNGNEFPIELSLAEWENASGMFFTGIIRDISERKKMEDALNTTLAELERSQAIAQVGNWKLDLSTRIFTASSEGLRLFGLEPKTEPKFQDVSDCIHPDYLALVSETLKKALLTKQKYSVEFLIHKKNTGELRHILSIGEVECGPDGNPTALIGVNQDITKQVKASNALRESEQKYRDIFNTVQDVFYQTDLEGTIIDISPSIYRFLGFGQEELLGSRVYDLYYDKNDRDKLVNEIRLHGELRDYEIRLKSKTGEIKYASVNAGLMLDENGATPHINGALRDITERKLAQEALQQSETIYRDLVDKLPDGVYKSTDAGKFVAVNPAMATMLGYENVDELMAVDIKKELYFDEADREMVELLEGNTKIGVYLMKKKDGSELWVEDHGWLVFDKDNNTLFHEGIMRDVSDRKKAEDALHLEQLFSKSVIDSLPGIFYLYSYPELRLVLFNKQQATLFGYEPAEIMGRHVTEWYQPELKQLALNAIDGVMQNGSGTLESHVLTKDGTPLPYYFTGIAFESQGKRYLMGTGNDITERKKAEKEIQRIGQHYKAIIEKAPDGIVLVSALGEMVFASPAAKKMFGYNVDEAFIGNPSDYTHPDDQQMVFMELIHLQQDPTYVPTLQYRFNEKNGKWRWVESTFTNMLADDSVEAIVINFRDITDSKLIQDELKASEDKYRTMIENSNDLIWTLDGNGNFSFFNNIAAKATGFKHEDWIGKSFLPIIFEEDTVMLMDVFNKSMNGISCSYEFRIRNADSNILFLSVNTSPVYSEGNIIGVVSFGRDITERKASEKQLKLLGRAIDQSPVTVVITNKNGEIEYANPKFTEVTGYTLEEVKGQNPRMLQSGEHPKEFYAELWDTVLSGNVWHGEFHNKKKNGESYWESAAISAITDSKGETSFFLAVKEDITEKKKMIADLIEAKNHAEESDRLKSAFLSNMSHEIRTPMNGILGFATLLKEPGLSGEQQQEYIKVIEKSGERMLNIIKDIVDISKIEAGLMDVDLKESDINEQTNFVYTFFKPEAESKGLKLFIKNGLVGKAAFVKTDREKLYAVLTNLIKNAIKYSDHGSIEFGYELQNPAQLQFFVKDTGIGIPTDRQEAIFDRFVQADISDKRAFQGAGLGLSISKAFIDMLGGKIWVESQEGKGSAFYFTLPYQATVEEKPIEAPILPVTKNEVQKLKILIAEDDPTSEMLITMALKIFSKELIKVKTGIEAVETCRNNPDIDLIMMDIKMPMLNGYDATRRIREFNKDVVIIAQTAYALIHEKEIALEAGCNDYISKPISIEFLRRLVQKYFAK